MSVPELVMVVPVAPALAAVVLSVGRWSEPLASRVATGAIAISALAIAIQAPAALASSPPSVAGLTLDRLSLLAASVIVFVSAIVHVFAARSMQGERRYVQFFAGIAMATASALTVALATNLGILAAGWILTGLCISALLGYYRERPQARRIARSHLALERIGDAALLVAVATALVVTHTLDIATIARAVHGSPSATVLGVAFVIAAMVRSALIPFHAWLPDSMETPTPVSALMHAGLVNGGGLLLARTAAVYIDAPLVLALALAAGSVTAAVGATFMVVRPDRKRRLGWSTVAQMGFMVAQCGTGNAAAAVLHLALHGCYKAWRFLSVGGAIAAALAARRLGSPMRSLPAALAASIGVIAPCVPLALLAFVWHAPTSAVVAAAFAWAVGATACTRLCRVQLGAATRIVSIVATCASVGAYVALVWGVDVYLAPVVHLRFMPWATVLATSVGFVGGIVGVAASADIRLAGPAFTDRLYVIALHEGRL